MTENIIHMPGRREPVTINGKLRKAEGNVEPLGVVTRLDLDPGRVLAMAEDQLEGVVVIGFDKEGEFYFASSYADGGDVIYLLEMAKKRLLEI